MLLLTMALPLLGGAALFLLRPASRRVRGLIAVGTSLCATAMVALCLFSPYTAPVTLPFLGDTLSFSFRLDGLGKVFAGLCAFLWPLATLYALEYMEGEENQNSFFGWYLFSYSVTLGVAMSGNLLTLYLFYELLTFATLPLVLHGMSARSVRAGRKYVYYSLFGAALVFVGLSMIVRYGSGPEFVFGGVLPSIAGKENVLRLGYVLCFFGFGVKAAVFPLHGWLPTASVAPTPVTALLHAVAVVKAGVFGVMRITYYSFGTSLLAGTWAQALPLSVAVFTIVYGSAMALREKHFKRRLAYSTVSNLSYVLFGVLLMTPQGFSAGLEHMVFHALMKLVLFCCVGAILVKTGRENVDQLHGLARRMPFIYALYTLAAAALVGVPPLVGFQSKWSLAEAGLAAGGVLGVGGAAALIVSAILTAGYVLTPVVTGVFLPLDERGLPQGNVDARACMKLPLCVLGALLLLLSLFSRPLIELLGRVASALVA